MTRTALSFPSCCSWSLGRVDEEETGSQAVMTQEWAGLGWSPQEELAQLGLKEGFLKEETSEVIFER